LLKIDKRGVGKERKRHEDGKEEVHWKLEEVVGSAQTS